MDQAQNFLRKWWVRIVWQGITPPQERPYIQAHKDREVTFIAVSEAIAKSYDQFKNLSPKELVKQRMDKYSQMGVYKD